jgi:hypothetical protein
VTLYDIDGALLAGILLAALLIAMHVGHRLGRRLAPDLRERIAAMSTSSRAAFSA